MEPPESTMVLPALLSVVALVLANAFFVAAEFALVGARRTRLEEMSRAGDRKASLALKALQHLDRYISATQLGITLSSLGLGWIGEPTIARLIEKLIMFLPAVPREVTAHSIAIAVAFALISILHIVLGELMPKAMALLYPETISSWTAAPLMGFAWLMAGPIKVLNGSANGLLKLFKFNPPAAHERVHSAEEIRMLVGQSEEGGQLREHDARLLEGVFEFTEKTAIDVMTPRTEIVGIDANQTIEQVAAVVADAGRSRYPAYNESLDDVVGIVHAKDLLSTLQRNPTASIRTIMRPPLLVPGTREVEDVLADMKRLKRHMAIVLDEYGGTAGLVTMEDLLEEIVGPIFDEYDVAERLAAADGAQIFDGAMALSEFNAAHGGKLDETDYTTLGGYLFGQLGRLPKPGDRVATNGMTFEIVAMEGRRVKTVKLVPAASGG